MVRFVELSHVLVDGMKAYPGLPDPRFTAFLDHEQSRPRYEGRAEFHLGLYELPGNVGTYIDSPFHRFVDRADLSELPLEKVASLEGIVLEAVIGVDRAVAVNVADQELKGKAVLICSRWDSHWGTPRYWEPGPFLGPKLVEQLIRAEAVLVAVDFANVDDTADLARPAHTGLLQAGIPIVEHLRDVGVLPRTGFRFTAAPLRIVRGSSFPVRAYAELS